VGFVTYKKKFAGVCWNFFLRIASAPENVFARFFGPFLACSSLSKISVFGWTRREICDSWSLSHLGYLYPGTTPVMIKLDTASVA